MSGRDRRPDAGRDGFCRRPLDRSTRPSGRLDRGGWWQGTRVRARVRSTRSGDEEGVPVPPAPLSAYGESSLFEDEATAKMTPPDSRFEHDLCWHLANVPPVRQPTAKTRENVSRNRHGICPRTLAATGVEYALGGAQTIQARRDSWGWGWSERQCGVAWGDGYCTTNPMRSKGRTTDRVRVINTPGGG